MRRSAQRPAFSLVAIALFLLAAAGCGKDDAPTKVVDDPEFDLAVPTESVQAWAAAFERKTYAEYDALLADDFQFYPRASDSAGFPWMVLDPWDRAVELSIAGHMFDPSFVGSHPPVIAITVTATLQSQTTNGNGRPELVFQVTGQILTGPVDGYAFDTRLKIELVEVGGKYKIREIEELESVANSMQSMSEASSFGSIKSLYRE